MSKKFGDQFSEERFNTGQREEDVVLSELGDIFDARNIIPIEPDETYDNFSNDKEIHQLVDYTGIDYLVDPFDSPIFGINHRTHTPTDATLRFDIRKDTGSTSPSELDKLMHADIGDIVPKYGSRMKLSEDGIEWFRVVDLVELVIEINDGLTPDKTWTDGDVVAWMYDYDYLYNEGLVVNFTPNNQTSKSELSDY